MKLLNWVACLCLLTAVGCGKDIGDSCKSVNECITTDTDRLCLTQDGEGFPGGYCTKFNCGGANACPEEAVCVAYRYTLGGGSCDEDDTLSRLQRNYCMLRCENDGDCRSGYKCLSVDGDNPHGAVIIDGQPGTKICALEYYEPAKKPERASEICEAEGLRGATSESDASSLVDAATSDAADPGGAASIGTSADTAEAAVTALGFDASAVLSSSSSVDAGD